jgi:hypothetical protein
MLLLLPLSHETMVIDGENVVIDLYGAQEGHNHKRAGLLPTETSTLPYDHDSLQVVFSSSKVSFTRRHHRPSDISDTMCYGMYGMV